MIIEIRCKGTTKIAHTQVLEEKFTKIQIKWSFYLRVSFFLCNFAAQNIIADTDSIKSGNNKIDIYRRKVSRLNILIKEAFALLFVEKN